MDRTESQRSQFCELDQVEVMLAVKLLEGAANLLTASEIPGFVKDSCDTEISADRERIEVGEADPSFSQAPGDFG